MKKVAVHLVGVEKWQSKDATYVVSAVNGEWDQKYPPLQILLNNVEKFHVQDGVQFAFHITDEHAYIVIDLKSSRLEIHNRSGEVAWRAKGMSVHLSNTPTGRGQRICKRPMGRMNGKYCSIASMSVAILFWRAIRICLPIRTIFTCAR